MAKELVTRNYPSFKGEFKIECYTGKKHGEGGWLQYVLIYNGKQFRKVEV